MNFAIFCRKMLRAQSGNRSSAQRESGQAAIFVLLLIPTAIAATLLVFNTGQVTASKLRVQNAADAAAFSAMELQARQMNLDAYLNRAMLANEVAIGQAVSILSWSRYAKSVGNNIQPVFQALGAVPVVGGVLAAYGKAVKAASQAVYGTGTGYASVFLPVANGMDAAYAGAEQAFNLALGKIDIVDGPVQQTVKQLVEINAPGAEVIGYQATALKYWAERRNFVTTWGGKKDPNGSDPGGRARMASMINENARGQGFTVNRDHGTGVPLSLYIWPIVKIGTHKSGGGQLALDRNGNYVWSGADSLSTGAYRGDVCGRWFPHFCWKRIYDAPWAWGGAWSLPSLSSFKYYQSDPVRWNGWQDPTVNPQAAGNAKTVQMPSYRVYQDAWSRDSRGMNQVVSDYSGHFGPDRIAIPGIGRADTKEGRGIARYRDLTWNTRIGKDGDITDTAPKYIVLVSLPTTKRRDSVTALGISGDPTQGGQIPSLGWMGMRLDTKGAGKQGNEGVRAVAAAQVYFRRPDALWARPDGLDERANLFSPFWSTRLVDLSTAEKTAIIGISSGI